MRSTTLILLAAALPLTARAQWDAHIPAFSGAAIMLGAQGFARPPITSAVTGAYAHLGIGRMLVGLQGATTVGDGVASQATYGLATVGYAQARGVSWQVYPFLGAGGAAFRTTVAEQDVQPAFGAGFGADGLVRPAGSSMMIGARIGYVTRSLGDDASVAYATLTVGLGRRRATPESFAALR